MCRQILFCDIARDQAILDDMHSGGDVTTIGLNFDIYISYYMSFDTLFPRRML